VVWTLAVGMGIIIWTGPLAGGPHWFNNFPDFPKPVQTYKIKMNAFHAPKIPKLFMRLD
jgi:hypothetical protein